MRTILVVFLVSLALGAALASWWFTRGDGAAAPEAPPLEKVVVLRFEASPAPATFTCEGGATVTAKAAAMFRVEAPAATAKSVRCTVGAEGYTSRADVEPFSPSFLGVVRLTKEGSVAAPVVGAASGTTPVDGTAPSGACEINKKAFYDVYPRGCLDVRFEKVALDACLAEKAKLCPEG